MTSEPRLHDPAGGGREVVVGVADTAAAHAAVVWSAERASSGGVGAGVTLLHVDEPDGPHRVVSRPALQILGIRDLLAREARFVRSVAPEASVRTERVRGAVMWALGAASAGAELVVVGTHKSGFIHGSVYGSTSLQLAATARCPVVVVPAAVGAGVGVVLGADGSPAGRAALTFAAAEAERLRTDLLIVRVLPIPDDASSTADAADRADALALLEEFRAIATAARPASAVDVRVIHGPVARVLVTMSTGARLLVLGDGRSDTGRDPLALGVVCHDALLNIQAATVIVHVGDPPPSAASVTSAALPATP